MAGRPWFRRPGNMLQIGVESPITAGHPLCRKSKRAGCPLPRGRGSERGRGPVGRTPWSADRRPRRSTCRRRGYRKSHGWTPVGARG
jgi:hypothetical protein